MSEKVPDRDDPIRISRRDDAGDQEIEADESKPVRIWYVVSNRRLNKVGRFIACPLTKAEERSMRTLLADNGELEETDEKGVRKRSVVDCQQPWTILSARVKGPSWARVLPTTSAEVDRLLNDHFKLDTEHSSSRYRQGGICWIRIRKKPAPADPSNERNSPERDVLRSISEGLLWREPHSPDHHLVPALILTHPRYLNPLRPDAAVGFQVMTLVPLLPTKVDASSSAPVFHAKLSKGGEVSLTPILDVLTTYYYGKARDGRPRVQFIHPDVKSWEYSADAVKKTITSIKKRICVAGEEK